MQQFWKSFRFTKVAVYLKMGDTVVYFPNYTIEIVGSIRNLTSF